MSNQSVKVRNGITFTPQSTPPANPVDGDVYYDSSLGLQLRKNGVWTSAGGGLGSWTEKTANYTAISGDDLGANTTGGSFTITLPASPVNGTKVRVADSGSFFGTNSCFIATSDSSTIQGSVSPLEIDVDDVWGEFVYDSNSTNWIILGPSSGGGGGGGGGSVSDAVYSGSWNGDITNAPSKNAIYDKLETMAARTVIFTNNTGSTIPVNSAVYIKSDGTLGLADASNLSTVEGMIGFAYAAIPDSTSGEILTFGKAMVIPDAPLSVGQIVFLSETAGQVTSTAPVTVGSWVQEVGIAVSTNEVIIGLDLIIQN